MKPTQRQIDAEIEQLKLVKPKVPRLTFFGDDNWSCIEASIAVLERRKPPDLFEGEYAGDSALHAQQWMEGEDRDPPSAGWKKLANPVAKRGRER